MAPLSIDERLCKEFLGRFRDCADPTWGFYVYGTYTRPQGPRSTNEDHDESKVQTAVDDVRLQSVLSKLHAHAADNLRYSEPAPYIQKFIDTLRLDAAAYLPGASLADVCTHFRQNYADGLDPEKDYDPEKCGPKYRWCLVINEKALQSIESAPEPIGPTPSEGVHPWDLALQADKVFVILLSGSYTTMKQPVILSVQGRGGTGRRREWNGWLKFSPVMLMRVYRETDSGDMETHFRAPDELVEFP